jgi:membrane associated rhomboid family serine protease
VRQAPLAALIVAANVVVFVLAERTGRTTQNATLIRFGAVSRDLVWQGQYWRLATSMFLHIGVTHLLWNGWFGFQISSQVERAIGHWRFLVLYLVSGVVGSAASVIGHRALSAGASGALFGLIGWQLIALRERLGSFAAMARDPAILRQLGMVGAWFVLGAFVGFDNYAHAGGLVFGAAFGWALAPTARRRAVRTALAAALPVAIVLLSLRPLPILHAQEHALRDAYDAKDPARVLALTEPLLDTSSRVQALAPRSRALLELGRYEEAIDATSEVIAHDPGYAFAYRIRGEARLQNRDLAGALADLEKAGALDPRLSRPKAVAWLRQQLDQGKNPD